ncbi:MAG: FtsX-like permease family protein [Thermoplasmata archaeon]
MLGIAVCATYAAGALVLLDGLENGSQSVLGRLGAGPYLAYRGGFPQLEPFGMDGDFQGPYRAGWLRAAELVTDASFVPVRVVAFSAGDLGGPAPTAGTTFASPSISGSGPDHTLVLRTEVGVVEVAVAPPGGPSFGLPETWILLSESDLRQIATWDARRYDLLFIEGREDAQQLADSGYTVLALASAPDFFEATLREARRLVGGLVGVSAVAIAVVAYSLTSLEIRYRRAETRTLRALGMDGRALGRLYGLQLVFIVAGGTVLGLAGGIVAANGLVSFAPLFGLPTVISPHLTLGGVVVPMAISLAAGLAGGGVGLLRHVRRWDHAPRR